MRAWQRKPSDEEHPLLGQFGKPAAGPVAAIEDQNRARRKLQPSVHRQVRSLAFGNHRDVRERPLMLQYQMDFGCSLFLLAKHPIEHRQH